MTDALARFTAAADASPTVDLHSLLVRRRGRVLAEAYWAPYAAADRQLVYSVSKTITATAVGLAAAEGLLALDARVVDLLPGSVPDPVDPAVATWTVHHLLSMSTGHDADTLEHLRGSGEPDQANSATSKLPAASPLPKKSSWPASWTSKPAWLHESRVRATSSVRRLFGVW